MTHDKPYITVTGDSNSTVELLASITTRYLYVSVYDVKETAGQPGPWLELNPELFDSLLEQLQSLRKQQHALNE